MNDSGTPIANPSWTGTLMLITARQGPLIWYGFLVSDTLDGASQLQTSCGPPWRAIRS